MKKLWFKNFYAKHFGYKDISDDYSRFVSSICVGFLHKGNLWSMNYAIRNMPKNTAVVEIGSYAGLSTAMIARYLKLNDRSAKIFTCDIWTFDFMDAPIKCGHHVKKMFMNNMKFLLGDLPFTMGIRSEDFFDAWDSKRYVRDVFGRLVRLGGEIGFAYIDGCHKYDIAIGDFYDVDLFLSPGGFILCDDTAEGCELYDTPFVRDILKTGRYELVIENPNALFRKIK